MHGVRWYFPPNIAGGHYTQFSQEPKPPLSWRSSQHLHPVVQEREEREKEEERRFLSPMTSSSVPTHKHVHEGRRHIHAGLVWMSDRCFLPLLLLVLIVADPVFCWCLSKLGLSIPRSWGGKANMFVWKFFGKAKLYFVSGKYDGVQRGTVTYTTPLCVFLCAGFPVHVHSRTCARSILPSQDKQ